MAGTINEPLIVSTWSEFIAAVNADTAYIKWADNSTIENVDITAKITGRVTRVDFNGLVINNLNISNIQGYYVFERQGVNFGIAEAMNLTVNHLSVFKSAKPCIHIFEEIVNCYLYDVYYEPQDDIYTDEYGEYDFALGANANICSWAVNSIVNMRSKDYAPRVPTLFATNSEVSFDYKWTKAVGTGVYSILFGREAPRVVTPFTAGRFEHCYVFGKFDLAEGQGTWHWSSPDLTLQGFLETNNSIFNIETVISEDCTFDRVGVRDIASTKSLFVINNGNAMERFEETLYSHTMVDDKPQNIVETLELDLRNRDWLDDNAFNYIVDDLYRYPQYVDSPDTSTLWTWRKSNYVNNAVPFLPFWKYPTINPPIYNGDVYEADYICVFDLATKQNEFNGHGLGILRPSSCRVVEELNGAYTLTLTHPKDEESKWQYILEMNIIKCMGQLFVIQRVDEVLSGGSYYVTAYAEHISYTLNDKWIFPPVTIAGYHGSTILASIMQQATDMGGDWQTQYTFAVGSDIEADENFRDWYDMPDGVTPYEMLLGGNGFIAKLGGELYRDNFELRIDKRMRNAQDNAFELAIGYNLTGIKRTVDLTTFCTYFRAYDTSNDDYGTWFAISYDPSTLPRAYPRNVVRSKNFTYDHEEYKEGQLERDAIAFWNQNCAPLVTYELNVKDLKHSPEYKDFVNNYRLKVGDKGRVWDERLSAWVEVEITRTEKDGITGETTKIVIGSQRSFTRPNSYAPITPIIIDADKVLEGYTPLEFMSDGKALKHCIIYGNQDGVGELAPISGKWAGETHYSTETGSADSETGYYSAGMFSVTAGNTYTATLESWEESLEVVYEVLYYTQNNEFISADIADTAAESYAFTVPDTATQARIQAASTAYISKFNTNGYSLTITITGTASQAIRKQLSAPLYEEDVLDLVNEVPTYNGNNTLTTTSNPRVRIQYREPVDNGDSKIIEGIPPLSFKGTGANLTNWIIWGNTGGVGALSSNLFNSALSNDYYRNGINQGTNTDYISSVALIQCEASTQYSFSVHSVYQGNITSISGTAFEYDATGNYIKQSPLYLSTVSNNETRNAKATFTTSATTRYVRFQISVSGYSDRLNLSTVLDFMFYTGSVKKEYQPYGCQFSLTIQSGNNTRTVNIPLTEPIEKGQTVSLQTTGIDIQTYNGDNQIIVNSDIQPEKMKIQL